MISFKLIMVGVILGGFIGIATQEYVLWISMGVAIGLALDAGKKMRSKSHKGV